MAYTVNRDRKHEEAIFCVLFVFFFMIEDEKPLFMTHSSASRITSQRIWILLSNHLFRNSSLPLSTLILQTTNLFKTFDIKLAIKETGIDFVTKSYLILDFWQLLSTNSNVISSFATSRPGTLQGSNTLQLKWFWNHLNTFGRLNW